jgi:hypothetical protein
VRVATVRSAARRFATDASYLGDDTRHATTRPSTSPSVGAGAYGGIEPESIRARDARRAAALPHDAAFSAVQRTTPFLELPDTPGFYDVSAARLPLRSMSMSMSRVRCANFRIPTLQHELLLHRRSLEQGRAR